MDVADTSTRSKVIVQCTDPDNLFERLQPKLQTRLPLGNLHWKSSSRPLRSIEDLDVSFTREESPSTESSSAARRHQIPGLRQTPFVKLLLVRCDDKETYKEKVRKDVKQWVKGLGSQTLSKNTKGQERHDACEYIILHIVLPNTPAANEPWSSKHIPFEATESTDSVNSKSKWPGKSRSTIYDKLRADFHSSSKAPLERVAQIRYADSSDVGSGLNQKDIDEQWKDFMDKLKIAILQSFDARVSQYEEDIREREAQQNLPGWNFCTFFILKEGLARGFENVGLIEDALSVYEELDAGLDAIIQSQSQPSDSDTTGHLLPFSKDLKSIIRSALDGEKPKVTESIDTTFATSLQQWVETESGSFPLKIERRDYQQLILRNEVCAFDLRVYIFVRQMQSSLRRAKVTPSSRKSRRSIETTYDAQILAEICERSVSFINLAGRNLRSDLYVAWGGQEGLDQDELKSQESMIENIVVSWKWSATLQVLDDCQIIRTLPKMSDNLSNHTHNGVKVVSGSSEDAKFVSKEISAEDNNKSSGTHGNSILSSDFLELNYITGRTDQWTFWAAELFSMMRSMIMDGKWRDDDLTSERRRTGEVSFNAITNAEDMKQTSTGVRSPSLSVLLSSKASQISAYKLLTICACRCSVAAGRRRTVRHLLLALARLEVQSHNTRAATEWLDSIDGILEDVARMPIDYTTLELYADCLQHEGRYQDHAKCLVILLRSFQYLPTHLDRAQNLIEELLTLSVETEPIEFDSNGIFLIDDVSHSIDLGDRKQGMSISVAIRLSFPAIMNFHGTIKLNLKASDINRPDDLIYFSEGNVHLNHDLQNLKLNCQTLTHGWYECQTLQLQLNNIRFKYSFITKESGEDDKSNQMELLPPPRMYVCPTSGSPYIQARHTPAVDLSKQRNIMIEIHPKEQRLENCTLRFKPKTAGFRLDLSATSARDGRLDVIRSGETTAIQIQRVEPETSFIMEIPYSTGSPDTLAVEFSVELIYHTEIGTFKLHDDLVVTIILPVSVKVQDIYQATANFLRYTISPTTLVPIILIDVLVEGEKTWDVRSLSTISTPIDIFPKEPANWFVQIMPRESKQLTSDYKKMNLSLQYLCMDEIILHTVENCFIADIENSSCGFAQRLLISHLRKRLPLTWTENDLEVITLTREIQLWTFEELDWSAALTALNKVERSQVRRWLQEWHNTRHVFQLDISSAPERELKLVVDVPAPKVMVTVDMQPQYQQGSLISVGIPIPTDLHISVDSQVDEDIEVNFQVVGQTDTWLIGGKRHASFTHRSGYGEHSSTLILMAQRTGHLLLPSIEVHCKRIDSGSTSVQYEVNCEVENLSHAKSISVIPNLHAVTVGIGDGDTTIGTWLIHSNILK